MERSGGQGPAQDDMEMAPVASGTVDTRSRARAASEPCANGVTANAPPTPTTTTGTAAQTEEPSAWRPRELHGNVMLQLSKSLIQSYNLINANYYKKHNLTQDSLMFGKKRKDKEVKPSEDYEVGAPDEIFNGRYRVSGKKLGNGSFGTVFDAVDMETGKPVAIKIVKKNKKFATQAQVEINILKQLHKPADNRRKYILSLLDDFVHKGHVCMVFEKYHSNLYELLRRTNHKGISLKLLRKFARQILQGLHYLAQPNVNIIHCDLKPENILLVHPTRSQLKIIDFGSACMSRKQVFTYIQSRFYRCPEVLLGLDYTCAIDMWSLGCILMEMHIGHPLFGGCDQYDQMRRIVNVLGMPPQEMIDRVTPSVRREFFDETRGEDCEEVEYSVRIRKRPSMMTRLGGESEFRTTLWNIVGGSTGGPKGLRREESGHSVNDYRLFIDLISRMLHYDPAKRITPAEALMHPFFNEYHRPDPVPEKKAKQARSNNMRDVYTTEQQLRHDMERVRLRRKRERREDGH